MKYTVNYTATKPLLEANWDDPVWTAAEAVSIACVRPESSDHRPETTLKVLYDQDGLYGIYQVHDHYVRVTHLGYQAPVCLDSCVEFFCKPPVGPGYFNLEMNAGGSFWFSYVRNPRRTEDGFEDFSMVDEKYGKLIQVKTTLPEMVEPERREPLTWVAQFQLPFAAMEPYCGTIDTTRDREWKANFYKCGDETSHPHWISWVPVHSLNFHLPECFGDMELAQN